MNELKTFNPNNQVVAFAVRKYTKPDKFELVIEKLTKIETRLTNLEADIKSIKTDIKSINVRLTNVETNQVRMQTTLEEHTQLFKSHGWIK